MWLFGKGSRHDRRRATQLGPKASRLLSRTNPGTYSPISITKFQGLYFTGGGTFLGLGPKYVGDKDRYNPGPRPASPGSELHTASLSNTLYVHSHLSKGVLTTCCQGCPELLRSELAMRAGRLFCCKCRAQGWGPNMGLTSPAGQKLPPNCYQSALSAGSSLYGPRTSMYPQAFLVCCSWTNWQPQTHDGHGAPLATASLVMLGAGPSSVSAYHWVEQVTLAVCLLLHTESCSMTLGKYSFFLPGWRCRPVIVAAW